MPKKKPKKKPRPPRRRAGVAASGPPAPRRPSALWVAAALAIAVLAVYWQVQHHGFVDYDDPDYVTENPVVQQGLTTAGARWAVTTFHASNWFPLTWLTHMLDCELFGLAPGGHHFTNVLLHVASTLLLLAFLRRATGRLWPSVFVAALFALHPTRVESVAWIAERKDVLSTFFWMLTLVAYGHYVARPGRGRYLLVASAFVLGLLAKPMLVTLPFVLLLLDFWPFCRWRRGQSCAAEAPPRAAGALVLEKLPLLLLAAGSSGLTLLAQRGALVAGEVLSFDLRAANAVVSYVRYLGKTLWPQDLSVFYPHPGMPPAWQVAAAGLLLATVTVWVLRQGKARPYLAVGWFWYLGTLVPVIGLVQVGVQAIADRYTYVPTIGLFLMVALGVPDLLPRGRRPAAALGLAAALVTLALAVRTSAQVGYWKDSETLFKRSLEVTEKNYLIHNNLGAVYLDQGRLELAKRHLSEALRFLPDYPQAANNLGLAEFRDGRLDAAIERYRQALDLDPGLAQAHDNLGNALSQAGRTEEAMRHYRRALELDDRRAETHNNLANALAVAGRLDDAIVSYETALEIAPEYSNAHANLAEILVRTGRLDEAVSHFEQALRFDPNHLQAHFNLGRALAVGDDLPGAIRHFQETIRLEPRLPEPYFYLGLAYAQSGDSRRAAEQHRILSEIQPAMAERLLQEIRR